MENDLRSFLEKDISNLKNKIINLDNKCKDYMQLYQSNFGAKQMLDILLAEREKELSNIIKKDEPI